MNYLKEVICIESPFLNRHLFEEWEKYLSDQEGTISTTLLSDREASDKLLPHNLSAESHPLSRLWITDDENTVSSLLSMGEAVLVLLHEGNASSSFWGIKYACENLTQIDMDYLEKVYRRYNSIPWDILETERLTLRETIVADVDTFLEIYSDPEITRYTENLYPREKEIAYTEDYIHNMYEFYGFGIWTVMEKASGKIIGRAGLAMREGFDIPELGYIIGTPWQHKGYATEALVAILAYAKKEFGFDTIRALVETENKKSRLLLEKLGFTVKEYSEQNQKLFAHYFQFLSE